MRFTKTQLGVISNALRVAAEHFDSNAKELTTLRQSRLAEQFERQSLDALAIYGAIEDREGIAN